jgi:hypothetical protein
VILFLETWRTVFVWEGYITILLLGEGEYVVVVM